MLLDQRVLQPYRDALEDVPVLFVGNEKELSEGNTRRLLRHLKDHPPTNGLGRP